MSLSMTVGTLWATVITVQLENSPLIILCRMASVAESIEAVASSNTRILFLLRRTLPKQKSCRCPILQFSPSSLTVEREFKYNKYRIGHTSQKHNNCYVCWKLNSPEESSRFGSILIVSLSWHFSRAYKP